MGGEQPAGAQGICARLVVCPFLPGAVRFDGRWARCLYLVVPLILGVAFSASGHCLYRRDILVEGSVQNPFEPGRQYDGDCQRQSVHPACLVRNDCSLRQFRQVIPS